MKLVLFISPCQSGGIQTIVKHQNTSLRCTARIFQVLEISIVTSVAWSSTSEPINSCLCSIYFVDFLPTSCNHTRITRRLISLICCDTNVSSTVWSQALGFVSVRNPTRRTQPRNVLTILQVTWKNHVSTEGLT